MDIEKAKWYLLDFSNITINSDIIEAVNEVLRYNKELEQEVKMLRKDKKK